MVGMRVRVYYNLHRHTFSIQHYIDGKGWRVRDYADEVSLRDVTFHVSEAGRQRVIREGRKNVHAYVIGTLTDALPACEVDVTYNPYKYKGFVDAVTLQPVACVDYARLTNRQVKVNKV